MLPDSNVPERTTGAAIDEAVQMFKARFGVTRAALADLTFIERRDEIWACRSALPAGIRSERLPGLRAVRRQGSALKPTSVFLIALGDLITASRVDLDRRALDHLLLGHRLPSPPNATEGHVALCFRGDVIGCGRIHNDQLQALIPTGRRRELLAALAADPRP